MAKKSVIERNKKRISLNLKYKEKRKAFKEKLMDKSLDMKERVRLAAEFSALPRNSSRVRINNRCFVTGRAKGYHRYFGVSRIILRDWALKGLLPGVLKKSL
jgi:small subunit ribosomal protein S14